MMIEALRRTGTEEYEIFEFLNFKTHKIAA